MEDLLEVLRRRHASESRNDGHRVALCLDSGGMRGAVIGGMVCAIEELGLTDLFDDVYGTSAGAMAGAYLLNGTPRSGTAIYYEHLTGHQFVRPWLAPFGGGLNLDLLFDAVVAQRTPLSAERISQRPTQLHPLVTNAKARGACDGREMFDLSCQFGLISALRAAVRVPVVCGNPWSHIPDLWRDACRVEPLLCRPH